jgi:hypothetical protein
MVGLELTQITEEFTEADVERALFTTEVLAKTDSNTADKSAAPNRGAKRQADQDEDSKEGHKKRQTKFPKNWKRQAAVKEADEDGKKKRQTRSTRSAAAKG